jgi:hypothetical protein
MSVPIVAMMIAAALRRCPGLIQPGRRWAERAITSSIRAPSSAIPDSMASTRASISPSRNA